MGQTEIAWKMQKHALQVYREVNGHGGIAVACKNLANLALAQHRTHSARPYLRCAIEQSALASDLNEDYFAALASTQGWLEEQDHHYSAALSAYQNAMKLWQQKHGEENWLVGWGYMLLGKASLEMGYANEAQDQMRTGLDILEKTAGPGSLKYLFAETTYAAALDANGAHAEAQTMRAQAQDALQRFYRQQCFHCTVSIDALALR
jgi:tetratricopeptide (TPR) repeat protein